MLNGCVHKAWPPMSCSTAAIVSGKSSSILCMCARPHVYPPLSSRMSSYHAPVPELDAKRAIRVVRNRLRPSIDDIFKVGDRFDKDIHHVLSLFTFRLD